MIYENSHTAPQCALETTVVKMKFWLFNVFLCCGLLIVLVEAACPDGYCRHSGGCYLVLGLNVTWIDARHYCSLLGGKLLHVDSSTKQTTTEGVLKRSFNIYPGKFWLDISDLLNPRDWKFMETRNSISYSNWDPLENNATSGNCVAFSRDNDYMWTITDCEQKMNFVCYASGIKVRKYTRNYYRYEYVDIEDDDVPC